VESQLCAAGNFPARSCSSKGEEDDEQTDCLGDALQWLYNCRTRLVDNKDNQNPSFTAQQVRNQIFTDVSGHAQR